MQQQTVQSALQFTYIDYGIMVLLLTSIVISLVRGFVREAMSLATWIIAFWLSFRFAGLVAPYFAGYITSPKGQMLVAFGVIFVISLIIGAMISFLIAQIVHKTGLSGTDRMLGMIFGLGRGVLLVGVLMLAASLTPLPKEQSWQHSVLIPHIKPLASWLHSLVPQEVSSKLV